MIDAIVILIGAVLAMFSVVVLAYPLIKSRSQGQPEMPEAEGEIAFPELDSLYESIRTLRLEYELGKLEENLYRQQMNDYRLRAAAVLRRRDERTFEAARLLEEEVLIARAALNSAGPDLAGVDSIVDDGDRGPGRCPSCGLGLDRELAECPRCAVELGPQSSDPP
ncbi:MAG: hypothetical protein BZY88_05840 [SAR202 cluster bacterium Io17-Chloro-G9]|nr:MAG: hypothetical protein BZY88_05840 [SAR202 cluster bacterium Io17-Chloro-G9]